MPQANVVEAAPEENVEKRGTKRSLAGEQDTSRADLEDLDKKRKEAHERMLEDPAGREWSRLSRELQIAKVAMERTEAGRKWKKLNNSFKAKSKTKDQRAANSARIRLQESTDGDCFPGDAVPSKFISELMITYIIPIFCMQI